LRSVPVKAARDFTFGTSTRLFTIDLFGGRLGPDYEVSADGQRFLCIVTRPALDAPPAQLVFVQNWNEELRARLAEPR